MKNLFHPLPVVNLVADYLERDGRWCRQAFQASAINSPYIAARAVYDLLVSRGCTPACIGQVMGDYSLEELRELVNATPEPGEEPKTCCLYFAPAVAAIPDTPPLKKNSTRRQGPGREFFVIYGSHT